jgi:hypothetical protein
MTVEEALKDLRKRIQNYESAVSTTVCILISHIACILRMPPSLRARQLLLVAFAVGGSYVGFRSFVSTCPSVYALRGFAVPDGVGRHHELHQALQSEFQGTWHVPRSLDVQSDALVAADVASYARMRRCVSTMSSLAHLGCAGVGTLETPRCSATAKSPIVYLRRIHTLS